MFSLLWTDDIFNHIVYQTNLYVDQKYQKTSKHKKDKNICNQKYADEHKKISAIKITGFARSIQFKINDCTDLDGS